MKPTDKVLYEGKWLKMIEVHREHNHKPYSAEVVCASSSGHGYGALRVIPIVSEEYLMLIANFRVPLEKYILEFPCGAKDNPEESDTECAARELNEETGYHCDIRGSIKDYPLKGVSNLYTLITSGGSRTVIANIDMKKPENLHPQQDLDDEECIKVHTIRLSHAHEDLLKLIKDNNYAVDQIVFGFVEALKVKQMLLKL